MPVDVSTFDPLAQDLAQDFYARIGELRGCPVGKTDLYGGLWMLTRYGDVWGALRDWETYSSAQGAAMVPVEGFGDIRLMPIDTDPPLQRQIRRLIDRYLTPKAISRSEDDLRAIAVGLIEGFQARGSCDLIKDFAEKYSATAFFQYAFGLPASDADLVIQWIYTIMATPHESAQAFTDFFSWTMNFLAERRATEFRPDILGSLLTGEVDGRPLTDAELMMTITLLVIGGVETTSHAVGHSIYQLLTHPHLLEQLQADRGLMPAAIEELLRIETPVPGLGRTCTRDVEIDGQTIREGERIIAYFGSANRDPDKFADPDEIRFDRPRETTPPHLTFGAGVHHCPGANLARLELRIALEEILDRLPDLALDTDLVEYRSGITRGLVSLPLTFRAVVPHA